MSSKYTYSDEPDSEKCTVEVESTYKKRSSTWDGFGLRSLLVLLLLATSFLAIRLLLRDHQRILKAPESDERHCGKNAAEARQRGCHFDLMTVGWVPQECYDEELSQEYTETQLWKFYIDENATVEADYEAVKRGDFEILYVNHDFHRQHCGFVWRKLVRSLTIGRPIDQRAWSFNHTKHCAKEMTGPLASGVQTRLTFEAFWCKSRPS